MTISGQVVGMTVPQEKKKKKEPSVKQQKSEKYGETTCMHQMQAGLIEEDFYGKKRNRYSFQVIYSSTPRSSSEVKSFSALEVEIDFYKTFHGHPRYHRTRTISCKNIMHPGRIVLLERKRPIIKNQDKGVIWDL